MPCQAEVGIQATQFDGRAEKKRDPAFAHSGAQKPVHKGLQEEEEVAGS